MPLGTLQLIPSEAWVGLLGVVSGSLLTTLGVLLTNRANLKSVNLQLIHEKNLALGRVKKEKLEELYILICLWENLFFSDYAYLLLVMKGDDTYNNYLDKHNLLNSKGTDFSRIEMIIDIYADNLKLAYGEVLEVREEINSIKSVHKKSYLNGEPGNLFLKPASNAQLKLGKACEKLKLLISESARQA